MSIYTECTAAARDLLTEGDTFTAQTIVMRASREQWLDKDWEEAEKHAPMILATMYRASQVVRYGIVPALAAPGTNQNDYVRRGSGLLVYGPPSVTQVVTPNGPFIAIPYASDPIKTKGGRPSVTTRDDFTPWPAAVVTLPDLPTGQEARERIQQLEVENAELRARLASVQAAVAA